MVAESALDRMVARLTTQRTFLNHAADLIANVPGDVLELGLGKGRTWSHLVAILPDRRVIAYDHGVHAPPELTPAKDRIVLGDLTETLPRARGPVALIHADIGTRDGQGELGTSDAALAKFIGEAATGLLAAGGVLVGDRDMAAPGLTETAVPDSEFPSGLTPWRYHMFQR